METKRWVIEPTITVHLDNTLIDYYLVIDNIVITNVMEYFMDRFGYHDFYKIDQYIKKKYNKIEEFKRYN